MYKVRVFLYIPYKNGKFSKMKNIYFGMNSNKKWFKVHAIFCLYKKTLTLYKYHPLPWDTLPHVVFVAMTGTPDAQPSVGLDATQGLDDQLHVVVSALMEAAGPAPPGPAPVFEVPTWHLHPPPNQTDNRLFSGPNSHVGTPTPPSKYPCNCSALILDSKNEVGSGRLVFWAVGLGFASFTLPILICVDFGGCRARCRRTRPLPTNMP